MQEFLKETDEELRRLNNGSYLKNYHLYPGIDLSYVFLRAERFFAKHGAFKNILEISYCKSGRAGRKTADGNAFYLGPGDYSVHTTDTCADSVITLPNGEYEGVIIFIDFDELSENNVEIFKSAKLTLSALYDKFCLGENGYSFAGNIQSESVFSGFYNEYNLFDSVYKRIKLAELVVYLINKEIGGNSLSLYRCEQVEAVRKVHALLMENMQCRFTIESLARDYLINPTTLKSVFKAVYGNSIAAHIREHRMQAAAQQLLTTQDSIADIAKAVGYENQSKFSTAFKDYHQMLPTQYRKQHRTGNIS